MNDFKGVEDLEQKIGNLLSFKFRYRGEELLDQTEAYFKKEMLFEDDEFIKALDFHESKMLQKKYAIGTEIYIPIRLYEGISIKNCILGASGYPLEETLDSLVFQRVFNISEKDYYGINKSSTDIFDQKYRVYEKYKYPEVFLLETINYDCLKGFLCTRHPYIILREDMIEKNKDNPYKKYYFDVSNFIRKDDIITYLNKTYKQGILKTDIQTYFDVIKYIDSDYFLKVQDFKNDPLFSLKNHEPYYCKDCISDGHFLDLKEMEKDERREYVKAYASYFPPGLPLADLLSHNDYISFVKGKNPYYP